MLSTHLSSKPKIDSCKTNKGQYEKGCQKCWSNHQVHCFSKHCRWQLKLFWLKFRNKKPFGVMFEDNILSSSDILQSPQKIQFQIVPPFNVSNTMEQFICYDNEREDIVIIFATRQSLLFLQNSEHWFVSCTGYFLLFLRNFFSFIQSMEFITLEMLLERIVYSEINVEKPILKSSGS